MISPTESIHLLDFLDFPDEIILEIAKACCTEDLFVLGRCCRRTFSVILEREDVLTERLLLEFPIAESIGVFSSRRWLTALVKAKRGMLEFREREMQKFRGCPHLLPPLNEKHNIFTQGGRLGSHHLTYAFSDLLLGVIALLSTHLDRIASKEDRIASQEDRITPQETSIKITTIKITTIKICKVKKTWLVVTWDELKAISQKIHNLVCAKRPEGCQVTLTQSKDK